LRRKAAQPMKAQPSREAVVPPSGTPTPAGFNADVVEVQISDYSGNSESQKEKLTAFLELERAIYEFAVDLIS
jgi:hypothetical protein